MTLRGQAGNPALDPGRSGKDPNFKAVFPPGKVVRLFLYRACFAILAMKTGWIAGPNPHAFPTNSGLAKDVPFSPLEEKASIRLAAACADDAQIDKSSWALANETPAQALAREHIRSLAV